MLNSEFLKIVLVGDKNIGKRSLLTSGFGVTPRSSRLYIPIEFNRIQAIANSKDWNVCCYDSLELASGPNAKMNVDFISRVVSGADAILMCYACNNPESLANLKTWYQNICLYLTPGTVIYLVGTKSDLEKRIAEKEMIDLTRNFKFEDHIKTSALSGTSIQQLFKKVITKIEKSRNQALEPSTNLEISTPIKSSTKLQGESIEKFAPVESQQMKGSYAKHLNVVDIVKQVEKTSSRVAPKKLANESIPLTLEDVLI